MRDIVLYEIRKCCEEMKEQAALSSDEGNDLNEKEQLLVETLQKILELSQIARKEGLLSLEEAIGELPDKGGYDTLKMLLELVVDGADPDLVEEMALMKYFASGSKGYDAFQYLMIMIGAADIQAGGNPRITEEKMLYAMPEKVAAAFRKHREQ